MVMKAFEIHLNGRYLLTAGIGDDAVLTTIINWLGGPPRPEGTGDFHFHAGGLDGTTGEHVDWSTPAIGVGDVVTVKIVEVAASEISPEHRRYLFDIAEHRRMTRE